MINQAANIKFGITLSGGGARAILHIGVLQALIDQGMRPTLVSGASMGAIIGAFFCAGYQPSFILNLIRTHGEQISFSAKNFINGYRDLSALKKLLIKYIPEDNFSTFKTPMFLSVTNLNKGINEIISEGKFYEYLLASAAVPILFKPRLINDEYYCDGGLTNNFPAKPLIDKCDKIIGVHANYIATKKDFSGLLSITERVYQIGVFNTVRNKIALCDYYIDPPEARNYALYDFHRADEIWRLGYREGIKLIQEMRKRNTI